MGYAQSSITLESLGLLTISARSDPARASETLQINIQEGEIVETIVTPTSRPTSSPAVGDVEQEATPTVVSTESPDGDVINTDIITVSHFFLGILGVIFSGGYGYALSNQSDEAGLEMKVRCILLPVVGSLIGYNYVALGFPGSRALLSALGIFAGLVTAIMLGVICLIGVKIWCIKIENSTNQSESRDKE